MFGFSWSLDFFLKINHSAGSVRIVLKQKKFSKSYLLHGLNLQPYDCSAHFLCLQSHALPTVLMSIALKTDTFMILIESCSFDLS